MTDTNIAETATEPTKACCGDSVLLEDGSCDAEGQCVAVVCVGNATQIGEAVAEAIGESETTEGTTAVTLDPASIGASCEKPLGSIVCNVTELSDAIGVAISKSLTEALAPQPVTTVDVEYICEKGELIKVATTFIDGIEQDTTKVSTGVLCEEDADIEVYEVTKCIEGTLHSVSYQRDTETGDEVIINDFDTEQPCVVENFNNMFMADEEGNCFLAKITIPDGAIFDMATGQQYKPTQVSCCPCTPPPQSYCVEYLGWDGPLDESAIKSGSADGETVEFEITVGANAPVTLVIDYFATSDNLWKSTWYTTLNDYLTSRGFDISLVEDAASKLRNVQPLWKLEYSGLPTSLHINKLNGRGIKMDFNEDGTVTTAYSWGDGSPDDEGISQPFFACGSVLVPGRYDI